MKPNFNEIVAEFSFVGEFLGARSFGIGHINDSYQANFKRPDGQIRRYLLQRVNHHVFKNPAHLMENIHLVTTYLREIINHNGGDPNRETLNLIPTIEGNSYYKSTDGNYWRAFVFIEGAQTYQIPESLEHVYHAGSAFGNFICMLSEFPLAKLHETIPDFHNTPMRYQRFMKTLEEDAYNRAQDAQDEIRFVTKRKYEISILVDLLIEGKLPERVTHNDTKFNNVMIDDETGKGVCIVDLDTVMPGLSLYDFGDAIRSITNSAEEDERDLSKVMFNVDAFESFSKGYLTAARSVLTARELELLPFSAKLITYELGMRFLTDHLDGDAYFRIHRENHNLDRCRAQFKLVRDMEDSMKIMSEIIQKYI